MQTIEHDGMAWPLETFLDCYRFVRTRGAIPWAAIGHPGALDVVTAAGELLRDQDAGAVAWHDVAAVRPADNCNTFAHCPGCGLDLVRSRIEVTAKPSPNRNPVGNSSVVLVTDYCETCQADCDDAGEYEAAA